MFSNPEAIEEGFIGTTGFEVGHKGEDLEKQRGEAMTFQLC